ncbi:hypothetical protein L6452_14232 [Arctium lappa]|uniref:Uncharacterized protein n=1 Tax=Arctium lappa TaxID=4217 RepID=A0ACB9CKD4_ARCLA|nr:hypothetical protein L6452_14232 [Arctium lappa]
MELPPPLGVATSIGYLDTAKISMDASLGGAIIGKGGVNCKQLCRRTGVKLAICDHESDGNPRSIELQGTFEQIKEESSSTTTRAGNASNENPNLVNLVDTLNDSHEDLATNVDTNVNVNNAYNDICFVLQSTRILDTRVWRPCIGIASRKF